jgi:NADPH-dependent curcumin reductase CurA
MSAARSYLPPVEIGAVMRGLAVGQVIASRHPGFAPGDWVHGPFGVQEHALSDGQNDDKIEVTEHLTRRATGPSNYTALLVSRATMAGFVVSDYASRYQPAITEMARWVVAGRLRSVEDTVHGDIEMRRTYPTIWTVSSDPFCARGVRGQLVYSSLCPITAVAWPSARSSSGMCCASTQLAP